MEDKTFTQEEVNAIVQERLAKEKAKFEKQIADVQKDVSQREKRLQALEKLTEKGLPAELVDLVHLDSDEALNTSLELLEKTYKNKSTQKPEGSLTQVYRPVSGNGLLKEDPIRSAMGLK